LHEQGLARFATEPYSRPKPGNLSNVYQHLTNYAINKHNANFQQNNRKGRTGESDDYGSDEDYGDEEEETGHKRSLFAIMKIIHD
jgi:hypothetical protein